MAITYPLDLPDGPVAASIDWNPVSVVGANRSQYTGKRQTYVWTGQWWAGTVYLPKMKDPAASVWVAWLLSLNGQEGTFRLVDPSKRASLGSASGNWAVGAGAVANSTTLPIQNGAGTFALGDNLQIGDRLHKVIKINAGSVDVFPRLRAAYAQGTLINYTNAAGLFCLASNRMPWSVGLAKVYGLQFDFVEDL